MEPDKRIQGSNWVLEKLENAGCADDFQSLLHWIEVVGKSGVSEGAAEKGREDRYWHRRYTWVNARVTHCSGRTERAKRDVHGPRAVTRGHHAAPAPPPRFTFTMLR